MTVRELPEGDPGKGAQITAFGGRGFGRGMVDGICRGKSWIAWRRGPCRRGNHGQAHHPGRRFPDQAELPPHEQPAPVRTSRPA